MSPNLQKIVTTLFSTLFLFGAIACGGKQTPEPQKGLAKYESKFLGNIISNTIPADYDTYWNAVTLENASKWGSVELVRNNMVWTKVDEAYHYATSRHMPFNQHSLLWGAQQPAWVNNLTPAQQITEIEDWIRLFCERYPQTNLLTVANEPINQPPFYARNLGGDGESGADWLIWAYEKAREYCPLQKLIISEYGVIADANLRSQYLEYVDLLNSRNLLDGIGIEGAALNRQNVTASQLGATLDELASRGLPIYLTEMYITKDDLEAQRSQYAELFPVIWEHPAVEGVTLWGYQHNATFEQSDLLMENNLPSPAMEWLMDYFKARMP